MRITGGQLRGRSVQCPEGLAVRPTASKVRQAFFNILSERIDQASFLDLFAGSGLMGFEAASRGAGLVTFVEESKKQALSIRKSIQLFEKELTQASEGTFSAEVVISDVRKVWPHINGFSYNIVFADPPYKKKYGEKILEGIMSHNLLADGGLIVLEHMRDDPQSPGMNLSGLSRVDYREYGQTALSFFGRT